MFSIQTHQLWPYCLTVMGKCRNNGNYWTKSCKTPQITQKIQTTQKKAEGRGEHLEDFQPYGKRLWGRHRLLIKFSHSWERLLEHPWKILHCYFELAWRFPPTAHSCVLLPLSVSNSAQCAQPWNLWCFGNFRHIQVLGVCFQWYKTQWAH